ncbi:MAG: HDOD domain-containing protein [Candidatus Omnitrophica bacterium]|nr:HDOD domain-containing protein [Candidatus Omnitrophota bacterium]
MSQVDILSSTSMALLRELSMGNISIKQLGEKISQDPTLSASLLKLANSAYFGIPNKVSTVNHAVSLLGFTAVRNLVQGLCLSDMNQSSRGSDDEEDRRRFSAHSMAVSKMAGILTKKFGFATLGRGEAETAGLLHDIGMLLLALSKKPQFEQLVAAYKMKGVEEAGQSKEGLPILELETDFFGFSHPELGSWLAGHWNLPTMIQEALMHHHGSVSQCFHRESVAIVQMANLICNEHEMTYVPEGFWGDADPSILRFLDSQNKIEIYESLPSSIEEDIEKVKQLYDFVCSGMKSPAEPQPIRKLEEKPTVEKPKEGSATKGTSTNLSYIVPGLPQIVGEKPVLGWILLLVFLISLVGCALGLATSNTLIGFVSLALAGGCWVFSILSE